MNWSACRLSWVARRRPGDPRRGEFVRPSGCGNILGQGIGRSARPGRPRRVRPRAICADPGGDRRPGAGRRGAARAAQDGHARGPARPSIETFLHALCLGLEGVRFIGHTHPTIAVGLLSGQRSRELFAGCMFPDQIVVLGPALAYVPYADPGLPLALAVRQAVNSFLDRHQRQPKVLLMENHGVIALGSTAQEVLNITHMLVKTCRIIATSFAAGGPRFLSPAQVERIDRRPDELARRKGFV